MREVLENEIIHNNSMQTHFISICSKVYNFIMHKQSNNLTKSMLFIYEGCM